MGYIFSIGYIVTLAISSVWLGFLGASLSVMTLSFGAALVSIVVYNAMNISSIKATHQTILLSPWLWLIMSISIALSWMFVYYAIVESSARFALSVDFLSIALVASLVGRYYKKSVFCVLAILVCYLQDPTSNLMSLFTSVLAGVAGYIYTRTSVVFSERHQLSALKLLSIRSYFLLFFSFIGFLLTLDGVDFQWPTIEWLNTMLLLIGLGLINQVIPNFCSQSGMQLLGATKYAFLMSTFPVMIFLLQGLFLDDMLLGPLFASLFAVLVLNFRVKNK